VHDLYVLKSGAGRGLSLAGALHGLGAATFNPYPVVAMCRDKITTSAILASAGIPVPDSWLIADVARARILLENGPLVVKPYRGSRGIGVRLVRSASELERIGPHAEPLFAQRYHTPDGWDRKLYVIGGSVFGVRRPWPARTVAEKLGVAFIPGDELCHIARTCSTTLGIDTFGFDVVYSSGHPHVVDLSALPGFKGVPGARWKLTDVIDAAARRAVSAGPHAVTI
jgi:ribosomal protein S6--L-glutamate ligase